MIPATYSQGFKRMRTKSIIADDQDSAAVYVDGTVGGKSYRFRLDTGARRTSIMSDDFTSGFKVVGTNKSSGAFAKTKDDLVETPEVRVGSLSQPSVTAIRIPKNVKRRDNLLGMDFLGNYALHFQYELRRVELVKSEATKNKKLPLDLFVGENGHPYVTFLGKMAFKRRASGTLALEQRFSIPDLCKSIPISSLKLELQSVPTRQVLRGKRLFICSRNLR